MPCRIGAADDPSVCNGSEADKHTTCGRLGYQCCPRLTQAYPDGDNSNRVAGNPRASIKNCARADTQRGCETMLMVISIRAGCGYFLDVKQLLECLGHNPRRQQRGTEGGVPRARLFHFDSQDSFADTRPGRILRAAAGGVNRGQRLGAEFRQ